MKNLQGIAHKIIPIHSNPSISIKRLSFSCGQRLEQLRSLPPASDPLLQASKPKPISQAVACRPHPQASCGTNWRWSHAAPVARESTSKKHFKTSIYSRMATMVATSPKKTILGFDQPPTVMQSDHDEATFCNSNNEQEEVSMVKDSSFPV